LRIGAPLGLLGIELSSRSRSRANGRLVAVDEEGFTLAVEQSYGNCKRYIHARTLEQVARNAGGVRPEGALLSATASSLLEACDTFFIATASRQPTLPLPGEGVDVSHRGGKPGFIRLAHREARTVLTIPDYEGNFMFNTLGNLEVNPRAGITAVDFETGDVLMLRGNARVSWDSPELAAFEGAERLLELACEGGWLLPGALPLAARKHSAF
jgi:hypothetical protein